MRTNSKNKKSGGMTKMQQGDLLLAKIRSHIARRALTGVVLLFTTVMILNASNIQTLVRAETTNDVATNLAINVGSLQILNVPLLAFTSGEVGTASTENAVHNNVAIKDTSAGASLWTLWINGTNMTGAATDYIPAANILVFPSTAELLNLGTFNNQSNAVGRGADGFNIIANTKLFNSIHDTPGTFGYRNLIFNATLSAILDADEYAGTITLTVIDGS